MMRQRYGNGQPIPEAEGWYKTRAGAVGTERWVGRFFSVASSPKNNYHREDD